jgi:hypothetical protein
MKMVRPTAESKEREEQVKEKLFLRRDRTVRIAAIFLALAQRGGSTRFRELWESPLVRQHVSSKSVLHKTLDYMSKRGMLKIERVSRKLTRIKLLLKLPDVVSQDVERIVQGAARRQDIAKRVTSNIECQSISSDEVYRLVYGMFIQSEAERLETIKKMLAVYSEPKIWPFLWWDLMQSMVVLPLIFHLEILRACEEKNLQATNAAFTVLATKLSKVLGSEQLGGYRRIFASLSGGLE